MNLNGFIVENKNEYYDLASQYFNNIDPEEYENVKVDDIVPKSISILIDHDFIPTPCIEIKLELYKNQIKKANYFLYVDEKKEFIDEFLY